MPILDIAGKRVEVGEEFLKLPPDQQNATVDEIAKSLGVGAKAAEPVSADNVVRSLSHGIPILGGAVDNFAATMDAATQPVLGRGSDEASFAERRAANLAKEAAKTKSFEDAHPIVDIGSKVLGAGGALTGAAMRIPGAASALGMTGTMPQMIGKGALSSLALGEADSMVRGTEPSPGVDLALGAAGPVLGRAIGKVAEKVMNRGAAPVPQNTINAGGVDIQIPPSDPAAASKIEIARKGAAGGSAEDLIKEADAQVAAQVKAAQESISASMDPTGASVRATPQDAAGRVASELGALEQTRFQTEQARTGRAVAEADQLRGGLAPDPYTGQPLTMADSPYSAAEAVGGGVARERDLSRLGVRQNYEAANAVPGTFDENVPRSMAEEIRGRANTGAEPLWVDPQSTGMANQALKLLDQTIGEGLFSNAAAPKPGAVRPAGVAPEGPSVASAAGSVAPTDAEVAFAQLTAKNVSPERARAAVANLPGADSLPRGPLEPHTVSTAAGGSVDLTPRVVEASSLKTSADAGYNADLQPRNRMRAASDMQINDMAKNLTPNRLGVSAEADRGAPIVGPDMMTESGNGRVLAIRQAYAEGGAQAQKYRDWLQSQGVDVSAYREPILVRERTTPMSAEERKAFTVAANQSSTLSLSGAERALADSRALTPEALALIRNPDDLGAVGNREFVRQFMGTVPTSERGALMTAKGDLSSEGLTRVRNAVMAKAYGNSAILSRAAESTKDEVKSISNALLSAAPEWAQLRAAVKAGVVPKELDATVHLLDAVERTARIRGKGTSLAEGLAQSDAFTKQSPESEAFMRLFYSADGSTAASGPQVSSAIRHYAQQAAKVDAAPGLDLGLAPLTARDILATTSAKVGAPAALAKEISEAAQAAAVPAKAAAPITEVGVREMDNARKRLNVLRSDAMRAAMAPGGNGSDLRAMNRIIDEFDNVIRDAHRAGRFSGDSDLAQELIARARASHSEHRQTFTSRGGADPVGRNVEKILGRYGDTAATPDEIAKLSYGPASNPGGGDAIRNTQRLRQIVGPTSPEWGGYKQGLVDYVKGDPAAGPAAQGRRVQQYLTGTNGRGHAAVALSAEERAALANHAENLIASEPVRLGDLKGVDKKIAKITGRLDGIPSSTKEIVADIYGSVSEAGSKGDGMAMLKRLKNDMTPEGFTQVKQGMLSHLLERPEGVKEWGYQQMSQNLYKFINGNGKESALFLWNKDVQDVRKLADAMAKQVPPAGSTNPSGTAPMLTKIAKGMSGWILPVLGGSHNGIVGVGTGWAVSKGINAVADARAAREVKSLYYGTQPSRPVDPRFARAGALIGQTAAGQIGSR